MERNPYAINVESNPYQIELAGNEHGRVLDDSSTSHTSSTNEYAPSNNYRARMPTRASISRQGKAIMKGVQDRGGCRLVICLLGVALCWLSSLQVASTFVEIIFTPKNGGPQVQQSWSEFGTQINLERERNIECINASLGTCVTTLQSNFDLMGFNVDVIALQNTYLVSNATAYQQKCADAQSRKIHSIQVYKLALTNNNKGILWNSNCTVAQQNNLNSMYTDPSMTSNQATTATTQYGNSNEVTWQQAYASMQARAAYDNAYWANKTAALRSWYVSQNLDVNLPSPPNFTTDFSGFNTDIGNYWACATLSDSPPCPYPGGLRASANATLADFKNKYAELTGTINAGRNASQKYLDQANAKVNSYKGYATTVAQQLANLKKTVDDLKCGQPCNDLDNSFPVSAPNINLPDSLSLSGYTIGSANIDLDSLMIGLNFSNYSAAVKQGLAAMTSGASGTVLQWTDQINTAVNTNFNWNASWGVDVGYNPPPVNIDTANVTNLTNTYISATNGQLADVAAKLNTGGGSVSAKNVTEDALRNLKLGANSISTTDYSYASLSGGFDLDLWFFSVSWIRFFSYFFDYAWRIWYSGRIFIRYWFGAAGTMPPIDIRSYRTTKATPMNVRIARYATHPLVLFSGAIVVAILVVSVILGIYIPMLQSYIQGCVKTDALGQSTFLSQNVYAAAFNAAVLQGNRDLSKGLNDYDTSRANLCGTKQQNAQDAFANQQYQLKIVRDNMQSVSDLLTNMEVCTSMNTWTQLNGAPTFHDFQYYTNTPNPITINPTWHINGCSMAGFDALGYLEPPPINCTSLPTCATLCGVDTSVVQGVSHRASCETEWYVHTTILQAVCSIVVFIFWNVCRTMLLDGLVRVYWKHLVQGTGLNFYSTCNQQGQIDNDTEDQLVVAIKESDASYRRMGIIYIVMSFVLNIPYIVFCFLLNIDIAYPY